MARRSPATTAPLGEFELVVMLAVLQQEENAYPVAIRDAIEARTGRAVSRAAVFITLERLEEKRHLSSRYGEPSAARGGRPRRFFTATRQGIAAVQRSIDAVDAMTQGLEKVLKRS